MPASAILLSILGLAPFIALGLTAVGPHPAQAARMMEGLIAWGSLILGFLGGLHWGLVLREPDPLAEPRLLVAPGRRHTRIGLAVLPLIAAWMTLMLPVVVPTWLALVVLIAGYILLLMAEHRYGAAMLLPSGYLWVRWLFTVVAVAMLTTVLTLTLLGQTIVL